MALHVGPVALLQVAEDDPFFGLYELGWALEVPIAVVGTAASLFLLRRAFPFSTHRLFAAAPNPGLGLVRVSILFALAWFGVVLATGAASDIVGFYEWMYWALALVVLLGFAFLFPLLGMLHVADVIERGNLAAGLVFSGFVLGTAFAFGGALTGEGPGWWVVMAFFLLAYVELRANMGLVSRLAGHLKEEARLERDASAGLLLGAVATASGLVSGRAAAGDFHGWEHDLPDYLRRLWPLIPIAVVGAFAGTSGRWSQRKLRIRAAASAAMVLGGLAYYFLT